MAVVVFGSTRLVDMAMEITLVDDTDVLGIGSHDPDGNFDLLFFRMMIGKNGNAKMVAMTSDEALAWYEQSHPAS